MSNEKIEFLNNSERERWIRVYQERLSLGTPGEAEHYATADRDVMRRTRTTPSDPAIIFREIHNKALRLRNSINAAAKCGLDIAPVLEMADELLALAKAADGEET